jgi:zinc and cadmium transporter
MVSFAIGALLGAAFLAILPHAFEVPGVDAHSVTLTVLCGILVFFLLEKMVIWRHCHTDDCEARAGRDKARHAATGNLILIGDGILIGGRGTIAAAFLTDLHLAWSRASRSSRMKSRRNSATSRSCCTAVSAAARHCSTTC